MDLIIHTAVYCAVRNDINSKNIMIAVYMSRDDIM